jgi:uncharacterized membrane protein YphA (DoxX/SURF4 family)
MTRVHFLWQLATTVLRLGLGGLLVWTGLVKIREPYDFLGAVYNYELVGPYVGLWIATILPWLELCAGASLLLNVVPRGGALLAVGLFAVFAVALAFATGDGLAISCGCGIGSPAGEVTGWGKLAEAIGLLLASAAVLADSVHVRVAWAAE